MKSPLHVFLIDNFDSFTFNLVDDFRKIGANVQVWRNDIDAQRALELAQNLPEPRLVVLSPGPGGPHDAGCCVPLIQQAEGRVPIFGVCLGLQAMVVAYGGRVDIAGDVVHGKSQEIEHDRRTLFAGLPSPLLVGRYHSLAACELPSVLRVSATCGETVMAVEHTEYPMAAVQFHPESLLTPRGGQILKNISTWAEAVS